jgi:hypothetical protein
MSTSMQQQWYCKKCGLEVTSSDGEPSANPLDVGKGCLDSAGHPLFNLPHAWAKAR